MLTATLLRLRGHPLVLSRHRGDHAAVYPRTSKVMTSASSLAYIRYADLVSVFGGARSRFVDAPSRRCFYRTETRRSFSKAVNSPDVSAGSRHIYWLGMDYLCCVLLLPSPGGPPALFFPLDCTLQHSSYAFIAHAIGVATNVLFRARRRNLGWQ